MGDFAALPADIWPNIVARDPAVARSAAATCKWLSRALRGVFTAQKVPTGYNIFSNYYSLTVVVREQCILTSNSPGNTKNMRFAPIDGVIALKYSDGRCVYVHMRPNYVVVSSCGNLYIALRCDLPDLSAFKHILGLRGAWRSCIFDGYDVIQTDEIADFCGGAAKNEPATHIFGPICDSQRRQTWARAEKDQYGSEPE